MRAYLRRNSKLRESMRRFIAYVLLTVVFFNSVPVTEAYAAVKNSSIGLEWGDTPGIEGEDNGDGILPDEIRYEFSSEFTSEDEKEKRITLDVFSDSEYTIFGVETPDGQMSAGGGTAEYLVNENGVYDFTIYYLKGDAQDIATPGDAQDMATPGDAQGMATPGDALEDNLASSANAEKDATSSNADEEKASSSDAWEELDEIPLENDLAESFAADVEDGSLRSATVSYEVTDILPFTHEFHMEASEDGAKAAVRLTVVPTEEDTVIHGIILPDGTRADGTEALFDVDKNGTLQFEVIYERNASQKAKTTPFGLVSLLIGRNTNEQTKVLTYDVNLLADEPMVDLTIEKESPWDYLSVTNDTIGHMVTVTLNIKKADSQYGTRTIRVESRNDWFTVENYVTQADFIKKAESDYSGVTYTIDNDKLGSGDGSLTRLQVLFRPRTDLRRSISEKIMEEPDFNTLAFGVKETTPGVAGDVTKELEIRRDYSETFIESSGLGIVKSDLTSIYHGTNALTDGRLKLFPRNSNDRELTFSGNNSIPSTFTTGYFYLPITKSFHTPVKDLKITIPFPDGFGSETGQSLPEGGKGWILTGSKDGLKLGNETVSSSEGMSGSAVVSSNVKSDDFFGTKNNKKPQIGFAVNSQLKADKSYFEYEPGDYTAKDPMMVSYQQLKRQSDGTYAWEQVEMNLGYLKVSVPKLDMKESKQAKVDSKSPNQGILGNGSYRITVTNKASDTALRGGNRARTYQDSGVFEATLPEQFAAASLKVDGALKGQTIQYQLSGDSTWKTTTTGVFSIPSGQYVAKVRIPIPASGIGEQSFTLDFQASIATGSTSLVTVSMSLSGTGYPDAEQLSVSWQPYSETASKVTSLWLGNSNKFHLFAPKPSSVAASAAEFSVVLRFDNEPLGKTPLYENVKINVTGDIKDGINALSLIDPQAVRWNGNNASSVKQVDLDTDDTPVTLTYTTVKHPEKRVYQIADPKQDQMIAWDIEEDDVLTSLEIFFEKVQFEVLMADGVKWLMGCNILRQGQTLNGAGQLQDIPEGEYTFRGTVVGDGLNLNVGKDTSNVKKTIYQKLDVVLKNPSIDVTVPSSIAQGSTIGEITFRIPGWEPVQVSGKYDNVKYPEGSAVYLPLNTGYYYLGGATGFSEKTINGTRYLVYDLSGKQVYVAYSPSRLFVRIPKDVILCVGSNAEIFKGTGYVDYGPLLSIPGEEFGLVFQEYESMVEDTVGLTADSGVDYSGKRLLPLNSYGESTIVSSSNNQLYVLTGLKNESADFLQTAIHPESYDQPFAEAMIVTGVSEVSDYRLMLGLPRTNVSSAGKTSQMSLYLKSLDSSSVTVTGGDPTSIRFLKQNGTTAADTVEDARFVEVLWDKLPGKTTLTVSLDLTMKEDDVYALSNERNAYLSAEAYAGGSTTPSAIPEQTGSFQFVWDTISGLVFQESETADPDGIYSSGDKIPTSFGGVKYKKPGSTSWTTSSTTTTINWKHTYNSASGIYKVAVKPVKAGPYTVSVSVPSGMVLTYDNKTGDGSNAFLRDTSTGFELYADTSGLRWGSGSRSFDEVNAGYYKNPGVTVEPNPLTLRRGDSSAVTVTPDSRSTVTGLTLNDGNTYAELGQGMGGGQPGDSMTWPLKGVALTTSTRYGNVTAENIFGDSYTITNALKYEVVRKPYVTFNRGSGSWTDGTTAVKKEIEIDAYGSSMDASLVPAVTPPAGQVFAGWKNSTTLFDPTTEDISQGTTLTASYVADADGNGIPDSYQTDLTFTAQNGGLLNGKSEPVAFSKLKMVTDPVTSPLYPNPEDNPANWSSTGSARLTLTEIPAVTVTDSELFQSLGTWKVNEETDFITSEALIARDYTGDTTLEAQIKALAVPVTYSLQDPANPELAAGTFNSTLDSDLYMVNPETGNAVRYFTPNAQLGWPAKTTIISPEGYAFMYWTVLQNGSYVPITNPSEYSVTAPVTLYAHYGADSNGDGTADELQIRVDFAAEDNRGTVAPDHQFVDSGEKLTASKMPEVTANSGYRHVGWKKQNTSVFVDLENEVITEASTYVAAMMPEDDVTIENGYALTGHGFVIESADEAKTITKEQVIKNAEARAWNITTGADAAVTISDADLAKITGAGAEGGIYEITLTAPPAGNGASRTIVVVVKGNNTTVVNPENPGDITLAITAKNTLMSKEEAAALQSHADLKSRIQPEAYVVETGKKLADSQITIDDNTFQLIKNTPFEGGAYVLDVTAAEGLQTAATAVDVVVKGSNTGGVEVDDDILVITAHGFVKPEGNLDAAKAKELSEVKAKLAGAGTDLTDDVQVNASQLAFINSDKDGIYPLSFFVSRTDAQGTAKTATVTVNVVVKGDQTGTDENNTIVVTADGFSLTQTEAKSLTEAQAAEKANAKAYVIETGEELAVTAAAADLTKIHNVTKEGGIFDLTFTAEHDGKRASAKVKAAVDGDQTIIDPEEPDTGMNVVITAQPVLLNNGVNKTIEEQALIKVNAKAKAYVLETGEELPVTMAAGHFAAIQVIGDEGGIAPMTLSAQKDGVTAEITVQVVVKGKNTDGIVVDGDILVIEAKNFAKTREEADLTAEIAKGDSKAAAKAYWIKKGDIDRGEILVDKENKQLAAINQNKDGIYPLTFSITKQNLAGEDKSAKVTVDVMVSGDGTSIDPHNKIALSAHGFTLEQSELADFDEAKAIEKAGASAYEVESLKAIIPTADGNQIQTIKDAGTEGGVYDLTFTAETEIEGQIYTVNRTVKAAVKGDQTGTTDPEGDVTVAITADHVLVDYETAKAMDNNALVAEAHAQAWIVETAVSLDQSNIKVTDDTFNAFKAITEKGGDTEITLAATDPASGATASVTVKAVVKGTATGGGEGENDILVITANGFVKQEAVLDAESAKTNSKVAAKWLKSNQSVDAGKIAVSDLTEINSGKEGIYDLTFTVTDTDEAGAEVTADVTVKVVVTGDQTGTDETGTIAITADGFNISQTDAKALDSAKAAEKANAKAYVIATGEALDVEAKAADLDAINAVTREGGIFDLTFTAAHEGKDAETEVKVVVEGDQTVIDPTDPDEEDKLAITAHGFTLENADAKALTEEAAKEKAEVKAVLIKSGTKAEDITVTGVEAINDAGTDGGIYELTFKATHGKQEASVTVNVVVKGSQTIIDPTDPDEKDKLAITAHGFTLENEEAKALTKETAKANADVKALLTKSGTEVTDITVTGEVAIMNAGTDGGIYDLTFTAVHGEQKASVTVNVVVKGSQTVIDPTDPDEEDKLAVTAHGFTLENADAKALTEEAAKEKAEVKAVLIKSGTKAEDITVTGVEAINNAGTDGGIYELTFKATHGKQEASVTVNVVVKGSQTIIDPTDPEDPDADKLAITAHGFTLENEEAKALTEETAKANADVKALLTKSGTEVTDITVTGVEAINDAGTDGGIYDLTFTAVHGEQKASVTVNVVVKGSQTVIDPTDPDEEDKLAITAHGFTLENADAKELTEEAAKAKAEVKAVLIKSGTKAEDITLEGMEAIVTAGTDGGIYDLTFTAVHGEQKASVTVSVVVKGSQTVIDPTDPENPDADKLAITAHGFILEHAEAKGLTEETAKANAEVKAVLTKSGTEVTNITAAGVEEITEAGEDGGIYKLTFTAVYGEGDKQQTASTTVNVVVKGSQTVIDPTDPENPDADKLVITAHGFTLENEEAKDLTEETAKTNAGVKALLTKSGTEVTDITIDGMQAITEAGRDGGIYDLTFTAIYGEQKASVTVSVAVKGSQTVIDPIDPDEKETLAISAKGFTLEHEEAAKLDETLAKEKSGVKAVIVETGKKVDNITVTGLEAIKAAGEDGGVYELTFAAETESGKKASTSVKVVVKGSQTTIDPPIDPDEKETLAITAFGFVKPDEAVLTAEDAKVLSKVQAWFVESGEQLSQEQISVDEVQLAVINQNAEGIYELTFTAAAAERAVGTRSVSTTVNVVVKGDQTIVDPIDPEDDALVLRGHGFERPKQQITAEEAITLAGVEAWLVKSGIRLPSSLIQVNAEQLTEINRNRTAEYPLTFTISYGDAYAELTVTVSVKRHGSGDGGSSGGSGGSGTGGSSGNGGPGVPTPIIPLVPGDSGMGAETGQGAGKTEDSEFSSTIPKTGVETNEDLYRNGFLIMFLAALLAGTGYTRRKKRKEK